jgi:hypothetical protein
MQTKSQDVLNWMEALALSSLDDIVEDLVYNFSHSNDPRGWLEKSYPYLIKKSMTRIAKTMESGLQTKVYKDIEWLEKELYTFSSHSFRLERNAVEFNIAYDQSGLSSTEASDTAKKNMYYKVGTGVATAIGFVLFGPFGSAVSLGGGLLAMSMMGKNLEREKAIIAERISQDCTNLIGQALSETGDRIQQLYEQISHQMTDFEQKWQTTQLQALKTEPEDTTQKEQDVRDSISALQTLQAKLENISY